ncbi:2-amino-4-hydroxy-6-hydroxymethyldihydropteridine diphosphokinase [Agromyces ramosus]|uniref:2-amino-4-hydroxy-6-hydroxymethyldihydropteridine diphosphokinase n=1 Tax=Agromyces ramosus TaxID=33879 RepID=A0ABU0R5H2_9MICO|nr:2-amino-4-hydroxy-6-hydroxymethyldihydropteridine diphosphokinase [Agromyces ramosus]MDQ0893331.1 2-amino-4-hydroxy-6-hydroxymethyldihydropteridine diphosphokinase [Agromyces ramosus]
MTRAVIAFGANLGDREATIATATRELADTEGVELRAVSPIYETPAIKVAGVDREAPRYLNGVLIVDTTLEPHALLTVLQGIEQRHGRVRAERWGDRTLDLDLIDVDGAEIADDRLVLPHPRAAERAFVLQPWLDVEPFAVLPGRGPITALRDAAPDEVVRR